MGRAPHFRIIEDTLKEAKRYPVLARGVTTLQVNMGAKCNMSCSHCHINAGANREELMERATLEQCVKVLRDFKIPTVDITGGAPEINPGYRWFVKECASLRVRIMTRTNLSILLEEGYEDMPEFFVARRVEVIASLPCYTSDGIDKMRGVGAFKSSIKALKLLNDAGYGRPDTGLLLSLVYNPAGAYVAPAQGLVEEDFRVKLKEQYGISFTNLFAITNMPVGRFFDFLERSGDLERYINCLIDGFNPAAVDNLMCKDLISVGWDGALFDCDFNHMLYLKCATEHPVIWDFDIKALEKRRIVLGLHCYACMAGNGSSCTGETI